jgi:hypothetical protein
MLAVREPGPRWPGIPIWVLIGSAAGSLENQEETASRSIPRRSELRTASDKRHQPSRLKITRHEVPKPVIRATDGGFALSVRSTFRQP